MKAKRWRFYNDTWQCEFVVVVGGTREAAGALWDLLTKGKPLKQKGTRVYASVFYSEGEKGTLLWFAEAPDAGTCAHEAMHSVAHVFRESGLGPMNEDTEEAYTYMTQWLVDQIMKRVYPKPAKRKDVPNEAIPDCRSDPAGPSGVHHGGGGQHGSPA